MWKEKFNAAFFHALVSLVIVFFIYKILFLYFYPPPFFLYSGGFGLFFILVGVDLIAGPLLTFVVFDFSKDRQKLIQDMGVVCFLQVIFLSYGLWVAYGWRPVALVFEVDRFRLLSAAEIKIDELGVALPEYRKLPVGEVRLLAAKKSTGEEYLTSVELAIKGFDLGQRPSRWVPYEQQALVALEAASPINALVRGHLGRVYDISTGTLKAVDLQNAREIRMETKSGAGVVILDGKGTVLGLLKQGS